MFMIQHKEEALKNLVRNQHKIKQKKHELFTILLEP